MRVAHLSLLNSELGSTAGIRSQLTMEAKAATQLGGDTWDTYVLAPEQDLGAYPNDLAGCLVPLPDSRRGRLSSRRFQASFVAGLVPEYDVILVRHVVADPFALVNYRRFSNVLPVLHTKTIDELEIGGSSLGLTAEKAILPATVRAAPAVVGVTSELGEWATRVAAVEKATFDYPNGMDMGRHNELPERQTVLNEVHALFVASRFYPWHGLERLVAAAAEYDKIGTESIVVHLVGEITQDQWRALSRNFQRVRFIAHGLVGAEQIDRLARLCSVAIGSLSLDEKNMREACTLKVREYLSMGLPVYSGHRDSAIPDPFPYYMAESHIDLRRMVDLARSVANVRPRAVRDAASIYIDKTTVMERLILQLKESGIWQRSRN